MEIKDSKFIKGVTGTDSVFEEDLLQIAFVGRSNVGKSSTINYLLGRKNLVKTSSTPGKTQEINFFSVSVRGPASDKEEEVYFVDLPGYGYARLSPQKREKLRKLILWYLLYSGAKNRVIALILDIRRGLGEFDEEIIALLEEKNIPYIVVANKTDLLNQKQKHIKMQEIKELTSEDNLVEFSANKKKGKEKFFSKLEELL